MNTGELQQQQQIGGITVTTTVANIDKHEPDHSVELARGAYIAANALEQESAQRAMLGRYVAHHMTEGADYGVIPGTKNKTLLKPGAEKLTQLFRCIPRFKVDDKVENWDTGLFYYRFTCQIVTQLDGTVVAEGVGSCSTYESRYRWRELGRRCPHCGKEAIIKGKAEYGGGWVCFGKKGGCGAKFGDADTGITSQQTGRVQNPDLLDQVNTVLKLAKKRALVDAAIALARCSDIFAQDLEDHDQPPPPAPAVTEDHFRQKLQSAASLQDLQTAWLTIPEHVQHKLVAVKDRLKALLTPPLLPPTSPPVAPDLAALRLELEAEIADQNTVYLTVIREHARAIGVDLSRTVPRIDELTVEQLAALLDALCGGQPSAVS